VTSGTYEMMFDTTQASTFNPAFINANGGTPAGAEAALLAGLTNGLAYFNIHTMMFEGGEIRANLVGGEPATPTTTATLGAATATNTVPAGTATATITVTPAGTATATTTVTPATPPGTATVTGQATSTATVMGPTSPTATSGPSGTPTTGAGTPTITGGTRGTATVTPSRAPTARTPGLGVPDDDSCSIVAPPGRGAWQLLIPAFLLLVARRRRS
jgi:hypothetical protein